MPQPQPDPDTNTRPPLKDEVRQAFQTDRMIWRGFLIVALSALFFGCAGAAIGGALGLLAPDYYRSLFRMSPQNSAVEVGIGQGLTQGLAIGIVIALVVIVSAAWYKSRITSGILAQLPDSEQATGKNDPA